MARFASDTVEQFMNIPAAKASDFKKATQRVYHGSSLTLPVARIQQRLKASFDPQGIFNPGRLYPASVHPGL